MSDYQYKPHIQLVPVPLWTANMRKLLPQSQWTKFRKALIDKQGLHCLTCGKDESESRKLSAHEEWLYDEASAPAVAKIYTVSLVCWHCHHVEHWGVTKSLVAQGTLTKRAIHDTIDHFCRLNNATKEDFSAHEKQATAIWERRSNILWRIDYGPFLGWVAATFARDPLNDEDWSSAVSDRWSGEQPPTMIEIVANLPSSAEG